MSEVTLCSANLNKNFGSQFDNSKISSRMDDLNVKITKGEEVYNARFIVITKTIIGIADEKMNVCAKVGEIPEAPEFKFDNVYLLVDGDIITVGDGKVEDEIGLQVAYEAGQYEAGQASNLKKFGVVFAVAMVAIGLVAYQQGLLPFGTPAKKV
jgi:hypothetical protein